MPFRKLIPPFTLTGTLTGQGMSVDQISLKHFLRERPVRGCLNGGRKILGGRSSSAICFLYSVYIETAVLVPKARISS